MLKLEDIADVRAYEKEREEFRKHIIATKKIRRIHLGEVLTFLFENKETMRFQIQEMARAEKLYSDEQIENELLVYNDLIPSRNILKSTLFIELVNPNFSTRGMNCIANQYTKPFNDRISWK